MPGIFKNAGTYLLPSFWILILILISVHDEGDERGCGMCQELRAETFQLCTTYQSLGMLYASSPSKHTNHQVCITPMNQIYSWCMSYVFNFTFVNAIYNIKNTYKSQKNAFISLTYHKVCCVIHFTTYHSQYASKSNMPISIHDTLTIYPKHINHT